MVQPWNLKKYNPDCKKASNILFYNSFSISKIENITEEQFQYFLNIDQSLDFEPFQSFFDSALFPVYDRDFLCFPPLLSIEEKPFFISDILFLENDNSVYFIANSVSEVENILIFQKFLDQYREK